MEEHPDSVVYAVKSGDYTKIGTTRDLAKRVSNLQTAHPVPLMVLGQRPGGRPLEKALHRQFASWRLGGEWFALTPAAEAELIARLNGGTHTVVLPPAIQTATARRVRRFTHAQHRQHGSRQKPKRSKRRGS